MLMSPVHDRVTVHGVRLDHRLRTAGAHSRLAAALHEVALDAVRVAPLSRAEQDWLRDALAGPVRTATEAALGTLSAELERVLVEREAPERIAAAISAARTRAARGEER
jgi:hypothetical protein